MKKIELLSPANNLTVGFEAINHGADAVYIGATKFGARAAAGNSIQDIETLCQYAHLYNSKVYVTLNTILYEHELEEAENLIRQLYNIGVDALIIQDMGLLMLNLPPIPLHASTQTDNRSLNKILFLEKAGFQRVILARELTLQEISSIHEKSTIELEAFVHGSVCVSYSGQCYMSYHDCGRSANRGECAQYCRLPYQLLDGDKNALLHEDYLLSMKDMNRVNSLNEMIKAGISTFKIEGRLKESGYVRNITALYRQRLDIILEGNNNYRKPSSGKSYFHFTPDPQKSFNRGSSDYFLHGRSAEMRQPETPKSLGEFVGKVEVLEENYFTVQTDTKFSNGDGFLFIDENGNTNGFRINKTEDDKLFPFMMPPLTVGMKLYRNHDQSFIKSLSDINTKRTIDVSILFEESDDGFRLTFTDEDQNIATHKFQAKKEPAQKEEQAFETVRTHLSKLGNTIFETKEIEVNWSKPFFFTHSQLGEWRRMLTEKLLLERTKKRFLNVENIPAKREKLCYPDTDHLTYLANVANKKAKEFYMDAGVVQVNPAMEIKFLKKTVLMTCKYCIKYELGFCQKAPDKMSFTVKEPLFLKNSNRLYKLEFDCDKCEMKIIG